MTIDILITVGILYFKDFIHKRTYPIDLVYIGNFIIKIFVIIIICIITIIFLLIKQKIFCIIGGIVYLILGALYWGYISYILYDFFYFENEKCYVCNEALILLIPHLISIILKGICSCIIKKIYNDLKNIEKYLFQRDHTKLIQKIASDIDVSILKDGPNENVLDINN